MTERIIFAAVLMLPLKLPRHVEAELYLEGKIYECAWRL